LPCFNIPQAFPVRKLGIGKAEELIITGKPSDPVIALVYEKHLRAVNLAKLLAPAERDLESGKTRPARDFLKEFKSAKKIQG
jgi:hypothetical protein